MSEKIPKHTPLHNYIFGWLNEPKTREELLNLFKKEFPVKAKKGKKYIENVVDGYLSRMMSWKYPPIKNIRNGKYARIDYIEHDILVEKNLRFLEEEFIGTSVKKDHIMKRKMIPDMHFKAIAIRRGIVYDDNYKKAVKLFREKYKINKSLKEIQEKYMKNSKW